jgi:hypothetical protein
VARDFDAQGSGSFVVRAHGGNGGARDPGLGWSGG